MLTASLDWTLEGRGCRQLAHSRASAAFRLVALQCDEEGGMFAVLIFMVCLVDTPTRCKVVQLPFEGSMQECLLFGQQLVAVWVKGNSGYMPTGRYHCTTSWGS
jgi:hypothetical protein